MKRKISFLLVFAMCLSNLTTFATSFETLDKTDIQTFVNYNDLESLVYENNQTIKSNDLALSVIQSPPGVAEGMKALWSASSSLNSLLSSINSVLLNCDPLTSPELYVALTAGKTSITLYKSDLDAQMEALQPTSDEDMESYIKQFDYIKQQLLWGAQSLYMAYLNLSITIDELNLTKQSLEDTISSLELRYELGQIAELDLINVKANVISIDSAILTLQYEQEKLLYDLNILIGRTFDTPLVILPSIEPDLEFLDTIDFETDFESVLENNYTYYTLTEAVSDAFSTYKDYKSDSAQYNYDMSLLNVEIEEQNMKSSFTKIYTSIAEKQRLIEVEEQILENKELNLTAEQLKYDLGKISLDSLNSTQNEYDTQKLAVKTAEYNLFVVIEQYKWAINGMITG